MAKYKQKKAKALNIDAVKYEPGKKDGLSAEEGLIMDNLVEVWNGFVKLEKQHPSEFDDFADGIHQLQNILGMRVLRRDYPNGWLIK